MHGSVGSGGMGIVVAAYDPELDRKVAIKIVASEREESRSRLVREAQAMARLSHPNVVTVHEVVWIGERAGIVMELVDGEDLAAWRDRGPHGWRDVGRRSTCRRRAGWPRRIAPASSIATSSRRTRCAARTASSA